MLNMGINTGFQLGTWPGTAGTSAQATPQGPSAATAGFGTTATANGGGGFGSDPVTNGVLGVGLLALFGLAFVWWSLPR